MLKDASRGLQPPSILLLTVLVAVQIVRAEFEDIFPGEVATVSTVHETGALDRMVSEYRGRMQSLTDLLDHYTRQRRRHIRKIVRRRVCAFHGHALT